LAHYLKVVSRERELRRTYKATTKTIEMDSSSEISDVLAGLPRVNGNLTTNDLTPLEHLNGDVSDEEEQEGSDEEGDDWDVESIFEDTLAELDDQQLLDGSERA
jgi:hypothetical protein